MYNSSAKGNLSMNRLGAALILGIFGALSLSATLLTTQPLDGTTTTFPGGDNCYSGPSSGTVAGFAVSANGDACYNYGDAGNPFGFGSNGHWYMGLIADDSSSTSITINLGGLYSWVGGFVNYAPESGAAVMAAIAADGTTVLESWNLAVSAPISTLGADNGGAFRGINVGSNSIQYLRFGGAFMAMHDITLGSSSIPEPATALLAAGSFALLGLLRRRR